MLGISKHGDRYLRTLLIHGARALLYRQGRGRAHPRAAWAARLGARRGPTWPRSRSPTTMRGCCGPCSAAAMVIAPRPSSFPSRPSAGAVIKWAREGKLLLATKRA